MSDGRSGPAGEVTGVLRDPAPVRSDLRGWIADRVRAIETTDQAREYLLEVAARLRAVGLGGGSTAG
jgi:hypothetical protein